MSIRKTAEELNISPHTLKNWLKRENQNLETFKTDPNRKKLTSRANKKDSTRQIIPSELFLYKRNRLPFSVLIQSLVQTDLSIIQTVFLFVLLLLRKRGFILCPEKGDISLDRIMEGAEKGSVLYKTISEFYKELDEIAVDDRIRELFYNRNLISASLIKEADLPGMVYQALRQEGNKIRQGAYYTPLPIIRKMLSPYRKISGYTSFLDPCCGSGMFLCTFAQMSGRPEQAGGVDKDPIAVFLAKVNLFLRFPGVESLDHIRQSDALLTESWQIETPSLIATNPPWGAHFSQSEKDLLKKKYPLIQSGESSSLFMAKAIEELPEESRASFLLPESLLYVKTHRDIRRHLLKTAPPLKILHHGRMFRGVYTTVVQMDIQKGGKQRKTAVRINRKGDFSRQEKHSLKRYKANPDSIFNIHCSHRDDGILERIYEGKVRKLSSDCKWVLGTVTGDNRHFLSGKMKKSRLPVLTGREIRPFAALPPRLFIRTDAGQWQQSRSPDDYKSEKLVYTFIGTKPAFAIDRRGIMTLNSANCLIPPEISDLEELALWYNSDLFRFLWRKQYRALKLLRNHLETLPLPEWDEIQRREIRSLVKSGENRQDIKPEINRIVFDFFGIPMDDREYIKSEE